MKVILPSKCALYVGNDLNVPNQQMCSECHLLCILNPFLCDTLILSIFNLLFVLFLQVFEKQVDPAAVVKILESKWSY